MKDSNLQWIEEIPESWEVKPFKYILKKKKTIIDKYNGEDVLSLSVKGVLKKDLDNPFGKLPASFDDYQSVEKGNLLLCLFDIDVTPRCVGIIEDNGITSPAYSQYQLTNNYDINYYYYLLLSMDLDKVLVSYSRTLRSSLTDEYFGAIKTIVPPLNEQKKISNFLKLETKSIDEIISSTKQSIELIKKLKRTLITESVTKGINNNITLVENKKVDWIDKYPIHWKLNKINRLFEIKKNIANDSGYDVLSVTQKGLKVKDISKNEGQMAADYSKYQLVNKGDFVMNHMDLLTGWIDCSNNEGVTSPDYRVFKNRNKEVAYNNYYKYVFQTCYSNKIFYGLGQGVSNLGRWRLQTDKFLNFYIPVPPLDEQIKIAEYIDQKIHQIDELIIEKENIIKEFETYKKSLIYEYVTGKKEVL